MSARAILLAFALAPIVTACAIDDATRPLAHKSEVGPRHDGTALSAKGQQTLYRFRVITGVDPAGDGEIQSGWFPPTGITINTSQPWHSLSFSGVTIDLVNFTHGDWTAGTCGTFTSAFTINRTNWDIAGTNPVLSYAGTWLGSLTVSQTSSPTSFGFDGDRVVNGVVTPAAGGIHNVVTNGNSAIETKDPTGNNDWFRLEIRSAALKFGSASTADGVTNPVGVEVACANFTIEARKATLITP